MAGNIKNIEKQKLQWVTLSGNHFEIIKLFLCYTLSNESRKPFGGNIQIHTLYYITTTIHLLLTAQKNIFFLAFYHHKPSQLVAWDSVRQPKQKSEMRIRNNNNNKKIIISHFALGQWYGMVVSWNAIFHPVLFSSSRVSHFTPATNRN